MMHRRCCISFSQGTSAKPDAASVDFSEATLAKACLQRRDSSPPKLHIVQQQTQQASLSIYGYIPMSLTKSLSPSIYAMAMTVQRLDNVDTLGSIPQDLAAWLEEFPDISTRTVLNNLKDPDQGPSVVACQLATYAIIGWHTEQYDWVREGFLSVPDRYTSVSFHCRTIY